MPKELLRVIARSMFEMLARQLTGAPSADEIDLTIEIMAKDLYSLGYDDRNTALIVDAFDHYGPRHDKWPTTRDIVETLKLRSAETFVPPKKITHQETDEEKEKRIARGVAALEGMREKLKKAHGSDPAKKDYTEAIKHQNHLDKVLGDLEKTYGDTQNRTVKTGRSSFVYQTNKGETA